MTSCDIVNVFANFLSSSCTCKVWVTHNRNMTGAQCFAGLCSENRLNMVCEKIFVTVLQYRNNITIITLMYNAQNLQNLHCCTFYNYIYA